jgi:hypothetical protein
MSISSRLRKYRLKRKVNKCISHNKMGFELGDTGVYVRGQNHEFVETVDHFKHMIPSDSQGTLPSCAGHTMANLAEWMMNQTKYNRVPYNKQVDGKAIWEHARSIFYKDNFGGLTLPQAFAAAKELGIIKGNYHTFPDFNNIFKTLERVPIPVGVYINESWYDCNSHNGYISPLPVLNYGHAVLLSGLTYQDGTPYVHLFNSWGKKWGADGVCTMSLDYFKECFMGAIWVDGEAGEKVDQYLI